MSITINLAIDLFAETRLEASTDSAIGPGASLNEVILRSEDQKVEVGFDWNELDSIRVPPQLELHYKLLRYFARTDRSHGRLLLSTQARSPAGAGLGGSSSLSVSLIGALAAWSRGRTFNPLHEGEQIIEVVRDVETTVIQVPAGLQDYYGAMFGGLQSLHWGTGAHQRAWLPEELITELESRLLLFYSGQSRNSGINNWALFKSFIDRKEEVRERFERISTATGKLEQALVNHDWNRVATAISEEWEVRRTLAPGISTPEIERAFSIARNLCPEMAGKVCGAGGGGCFLSSFHPLLTDKKLRKL